MPPAGYTTVMILEETAGKLAEIIVAHDFESMADTIDYAVDVARDPEALSNAELTRLLYRRLD
jgi:hypothetical protein